VKIVVGADHYGFRLKEAVREHLAAAGHEVVDVGVFDDAPVDYPDVAVVAARSVAAGTADRAVLCCGTGLGMAITANKIPGVRAASVTDPYSAERAMKSNDARVLCLGGRVIGPEVAKLLVDHWIASEFAGGESARKVAKIEAIERENPRAGRTDVR
jgi:ribose 5-phosphate isomerase B